MSLNCIHVYNVCCDKNELYQQVSRLSIDVKWTCKPVMKNCLDFVILCINRWLPKIELTAWHKIALFPRCHIRSFPPNFCVSCRNACRDYSDADAMNTNRIERSSSDSLPLYSQKWSISHFPCSLTRIITSQSMKSLAFHSLLRWKMIILPILTTSLIHLS